MGSSAQGDLYVDFTVSSSDSSSDLSRIRRLLEFVAALEGARGELGIWLCSDDEIANLHLRYMNIPGPTDVITFPGDEGYLGDIAVSVDTAAEQARDAGHSAQREIAYLCLHGLLHICGYDDTEEESRQRMISRQDTLMGLFEEEEPSGW